MDYREKIEKYLADNGIQKKWFAEKIGLTPASLFMVLSGRRKMPEKYWSKVIELTKGYITKKDFVKEALRKYRSND